jgi:HD-like signal output (HDOD) protein
MAIECRENLAGPGNADAFAFVQALAGELSGGKVEIPAFPDVAVRIRKALADDECDTGQIARIVGAEPGLAARLLGMANSVALNPAGARISALKVAIARIGFANVRTASLVFAMEQIRKAESLASIREPLNRLWERSVQVAAMAFVAARRWTRVDPDQALLAGLMHGVGRVYIMARATDHPGLFADPAAYHSILRDWHAPIAKAVLESWEIAPDIVEAVGQFEQLERDSEDPPDLTDVLTIADRLVDLQADGEDLSMQLAQISASRRLGLTPESCRQVLEESAEELASLHAALGG